ncbi:MAG: DNA/RNA nuclease SfsA, partial [Thermoplasmata archaeon]|nr:DNA/RNA nuclease SfsA [Thermoplasmata archaeon]
MHPLITIKNVRECVIHRRINRFVVEIEVNGETKRGYINNTGRLLEYIKKGEKGFCLKNKNGKTDFRLFAINEKGLGAVVDTNLQMKGFEKAFSQKLIPWLREWSFIKRNVRLGDSIIDYLFSRNNVLLYLEVKSAVLREKNYAMYPDCPSLRGRRHIREITQHVS